MLKQCFYRRNLLPCNSISKRCILAYLLIDVCATFYEIVDFSNIAIIRCHK